MNKSNNYNSIVFLTTLSVYLGLVIVGATPPQALAQVETYQKSVRPSFDLTEPQIKLFIEYPYAERLIEFAKGTPVRIEYLKNTSPQEILDENFYAKATTFSPYVGEDGEILEKGYIDSDKNVEWMSAAHAGIMADVSLELLDPLTDFSKKKVKKSIFQNSVEIILNDSEYKCELVIKKSSNQKADNLGIQLKFAVDYLASKAKNSSVKRIYENTKVTSENNQVFIVTRLPRASIDEFLARKDAK